MRDVAEPTFNGQRSARRLHQDIDEASSRHADALSPHLQDHARRLGWPEDAVRHLYVGYADGGYHPRYHDDGRSTVESLEYGGINHRPKPALRTWALHSHEHGSALHDVGLRDALLSELF